jgi:hypothetical protein
MPGNQKPRSRKHRGTQTGSISRSRSSRPRNRQEAVAQARNRKSGGGKRSATVDRRDLPPTWRGAVIRGVIFAALLFPVSILLKQDPAQAAILSVIAAGFYIPLGFYTEGFFYRRRQQKLQQARAAKSAENARRKGG